ncbi:hypothetical protein COOONC_08991 [Cooperia oncophora]
MYSCISDLLSATGYLLFQEPAWLGLAPTFYLENAWWIAKNFFQIVNICGIAVSNVPLYLHFFLAVNRFTAIRLPARPIYTGEGFQATVIFKGYQMDNGQIKSVAFRFVHPFPTQMYTLYVLCLSAFIFPTILVYVYLLGYIWFLKVIFHIIILC